MQNKNEQLLNPVRIWRKENGITLQLAASMFDVSIDTVKNWEAREDLPYVFNLVRLESTIGSGTVNSLMQWKMAFYEKQAARKNSQKQKGKK